jgi:hypothetical protein
MSFGVLQLHSSVRHKLDCDLHELRIRYVPQHCQPCDLSSLERELFIWYLLELDELVMSEVRSTSAALQIVLTPQLFSRLLVVYWSFDIRLPRNLAGSCVGYDAAGICDSSLTGLQGVFVVNNGKSRCDGEHWRLKWLAEHQLVPRGV